MLSFRRKIQISFFLVFLLIVGVTIPLVLKSVTRIVTKAMEDRTNELIEIVARAESNEAMVKRLKDHKFQIFFRVSIIDHNRQVLYDSHTKRLLGAEFSQTFVVDHPEVQDALTKGEGYSEAYSEILGQKLSYYAKTFDFKGRRYVMRTAFPYQYLIEVKRDLTIGFVGITLLVLLSFTILTWTVFSHLTRPIRQIIRAVKPYQEGKATTIPEISMGKMSPDDDFGKLAITLNSLSEKVQNHIDSLTSERNEKVAILESLEEGVIAVNSRMQVTHANQSALKLLGIEGESIVNRSFKELDQPRCEELLEVCQAEGRILTGATELRFPHKRVYLDLTATPKIGKSGAVLILEDKSPHYRLMEMRKEFVANASHELRTPITIIRGFAETMHDNPTLPTDTQIDITAKIARNCERMSALIANLLTLADIEKLPRSRLEQIDLASLLKTCKKNLMVVYPEASLEIERNPAQDLHLFGDPNLLELAIMNLLTNGAKYSEGPAELTMTIKMDEKNIQIDVADKGIGIPEDALPSIFQRFYRVNKQLSKRMGGSGLGLSIVETIVEKHFGEISCKSKVGEGTTFTIRLPLHLEKVL